VNPSDITINVLACFCSNAEEAYHRIWRHATQCNANDILIYSPDTDIYNIGLSLANQPTKNYIIQLNVSHSLQTKYLILNNLKMALVRDPDLSTLPDENLGTIMNISTGCDYISYFKLLGKAIILNNFQYSQFITGRDMTGSLHQTQQATKQYGFLDL